MVTSYLVLAGIAVCAWAPILFRFYRNWQHRHNPISLAICSAVTLLMWLAVAQIWEITGDVKGEVVSFVSTGLSIVVAAYANYTFYVAAKKFGENREE
jgi:RsiW-degrading membrane proteinase PrsW (M82 family)